MEINFNPYTANVLDYVGKPLATVDGRRVQITQAMNGDFAILVNGEPVESGLGNLAASSILNRMQCVLVR